METANLPSANGKNPVLLKAFGWVLFIAGLVVIGWTLISSYNIFTGKTAAPEVFKIEAEEISAADQGKIPTTPEEIQKEMEKIIHEQLKDVLPAGFLPGILNLTAWSILAFILIFGGAQVSGIGIKLIKR